jgi:hypothetical protein
VRLALHSSQYPKQRHLPCIMMAAVLLDTFAGLYPHVHCARASAQCSDLQTAYTVQPACAASLTAPSRCADGTGTIKSPHTSASPHTCRQQDTRTGIKTQHWLAAGGRLLQCQLAAPCSMSMLHIVHNADTERTQVRSTQRGKQPPPLLLFSPF